MIELSIVTCMISGFIIAKAIYSPSQQAISTDLNEIERKLQHFNDL